MEPEQQYIIKQAEAGAPTADILQEAAFRVVLPGMRGAVTIRYVGVLNLFAQNLTYPDLLDHGSVVPGEPLAPSVSARLILTNICEAFVEPRCSLAPDREKGEFHPADLPPEAQRFMVDFVSGKVDACGRSVQAFRSEPGV